MASYLRPRRGKEATAKSQNIVLKRGEIFFETPAGGVGTGIGRLKMGDGSTSYASLPYFLRQLDLNDNNTKCAFTNVTAATNKSNNNTYLNNIAPGNSLKTLFQNIKQLLLNYNSQLTSLNNDLAIRSCIYTELQNRDGHCPGILNTCIYNAGFRDSSGHADSSKYYFFFVYAYNLQTQTYFWTGAVTYKPGTVPLVSCIHCEGITYNLSNQLGTLSFNSCSGIAVALIGRI